MNDGVLPICLAECDPLAPACPTPDNLCLPQPSDEGFQCVINTSGDMTPYGSPCEYNNSCNQGLLCVAAELVPDPMCAAGGLDRCCSEVCDLSGPNNCAGMAGGQECIAYYDPAMTPPGYENVGVCGVPN